MVQSTGNNGGNENNRGHRDDAYMRRLREEEERTRRELEMWHERNRRLQEALARNAAAKAEKEKK